MRRIAGAVGLAIVALTATCIADCSGLEAWMRVPGGEYVEGPMPEDDAGPEVVSLFVSTSTFTPGSRGKPLLGALGADATGVAIGIEGDAGYWILPAGLPSVIEPDFPTYSVSLDFSGDAPLEPLELVVRATNADGVFGPASVVTLEPLAVPIPEAPLVVSLSWDVEADLDLHVVDPNGIEIYKGDINSFQNPPPGEPPAQPGDPEMGGILDFDSNAQCVIDGRREENVIWAVERPSGHYIVRVDTFSLCGAADADWVVTVAADGVLLAEAHGLATQWDEQQPHDRGAGVTALEVDLP